MESKRWALTGIVLIVCGLLAYAMWLTGKAEPLIGLLPLGLFLLFVWE